MDAQAPASAARAPVPCSGMLTSAAAGPLEARSGGLPGGIA